MKNLKLWLTTALLLTVTNYIAAQQYEAWPLGNGKTDTAIVVFQYTEPEDRGGGSLYTKSEDYLHEEDSVVMMRGTKLTLKFPKVITYQDKSLFSMFTISTPDKRPLVAVTDSTGKTYYADPYELRFSPSNAEGTENPIAKYTEFKGRHFYEGAFLICIFFFMWVAWRLSRRASKIGMKKNAMGTLKRHNWLIGLLLFIVPFIVFINVVLEIDAVTKLGEDCCWWLNGAYVGDFQRFFNIFLLFLAVRWQYKTIDAYATGMEAFLCSGKAVPRQQMLFNILISVVIFAVLAFIGVCLYAWVGHTFGTVVLYISAIAGIGYLLYSLFAMFIQMKQSAGWFLTILYTFFVILWAIGTILMVGVLIWQILKIIIPFIILMLFGKMIPALGLDKPAPPMKWYDNAGGVHDSAMARDLRNQALESYK